MEPSGWMSPAPGMRRSLNRNPFVPSQSNCRYLGGVLLALGFFTMIVKPVSGPPDEQPAIALRQQTIPKACAVPFEKLRLRPIDLRPMEFHILPPRRYP